MQDLTLNPHDPQSAAEAARGPRVVTVTTPGGTSSDTASAANTFTVLGTLILTPDFLTLTEGGTANLTISILTPAPTGGIEVTLESANTGIATVTSPVTIIEGATSTTATVTGVSPGAINVSVTAVGFGAAQAVVDVQAFQGGPPPTLTITEPADGATVPEGTLIVRGTVDAGGLEVGVTVNDVIAVVEGNTFVALLPVIPETTTVTAVATTAAGGTASDAINLTVTPAPDPDLIVRLRPSPPGGVAPLAVDFSLLGGPVPTTINLDFDGNGTVDFSGPSLESQTFTYSQPGLFFPTATVTDADGNQFTGSSVVQVLDQAALDAVLQAKWTGTKDALRAGDVAQAVAFIHTETRAAYEAQLSQISAAGLANIDQYMTTIQLIEVGPNGAQYEMLRDRNGQMLSFGVWFEVDQDGVWRLRRF